MAKHMVTCVICGKRFDANRGGYYNGDSRRYTCKKCGRTQALTPAQRAQRKEKRLKVLSWVGSVFLILSGMAYFPKAAFFPFFAAGALIAPIEPWQELLSTHKISGWIKTGIVIALIVLAFVLIP